MRSPWPVAVGRMEAGSVVTIRAPRGEGPSERRPRGSNPHRPTQAQTLARQKQIVIDRDAESLTWAEIAAKHGLGQKEARAAYRLYKNEIAPIIGDASMPHSVTRHSGGLASVSLRSSSGRGSRRPGWRLDACRPAGLASAGSRAPLAQNGSPAQAMPMKSGVLGPPATAAVTSPNRPTVLDSGLCHRPEGSLMVWKIRPALTVHRCRFPPTLAHAGRVRGRTGVPLKLGSPTSPRTLPKSSNAPPALPNTV